MEEVRKRSCGDVYFLQNPTEAKEVVKLHIRRIKSGFLSKLGQEFLAEFYKRVGQSKYGTCLIVRKAGKPLGFIADLTDLSSFCRDFVKKKAMKIGFILLGKLSNCRILRGILEGIFYPRRR